MILLLDFTSSNTSQFPNMCYVLDVEGILLEAIDSIHHVYSTQTIKIERPYYYFLYLCLRPYISNDRPLVENATTYLQPS